MKCATGVVHLKKVFLPAFLVFFITLSSYIRYSKTMSISVDFNYPDKVWSHINLYIYLFSILFYAIFYFRIVLNKDAFSLKETKKIAYLLVSISFFMLPMLSNDLFSFLAYGESVNRGLNPYILNNVVTHTNFIKYIKNWHDAPCVYGPVALLFSVVATYFDFNNIFTTILFVKIIFLLFSVVFIETSFYLVQRHHQTSKINLFALIVLSPVFWINGIGQNHTDLFAATFLILFVFMLREKKILLSVVFITLAILSKLYALVFLPLPFLLLLKLRLYRKIIFSLLLIILISTAAYLPLWQGVKTITNPISFILKKQPSNSPVEIFTDGFIFSKHFFTEKKIPSLTQERLKYYPFLKKVFQISALILSFFILYYFVFKTKNGEEDFIHIFSFIFILAIYFFSSSFYPWYLLSLLPFLTSKIEKPELLTTFFLLIFSTLIIGHTLLSKEMLTIKILIPLANFTVMILFFIKLFYVRKLKKMSSDN